MRKITFIISLLMLLTFVTKAADFYWVGNSGNWSDFAMHWATTSGGSVFHTNTPTQSDNVFFDANSFTMPLSVVTVDVVATFNNMNWTGVTNSPDLAGWNQMDIYGSLTFSSGMTASYSGMLTFKSFLTGNTVDFSTVPLSINQIQFDGLGSWSILSDIDISAGFGQISVLSGTVNFNNHIYNLGMFQSWSMGVSRTINMGSCTMNVQNFMLNMPESLSFNAGTSTINISNSWFNGLGFAYYDVNFPLQWSSNVSIQGSNTFHNLGLNYANVTGLVLEAGKIQTINSISFGATCSNRKFIVSSIQGQTTTLKKISGTVHENNLIIQDITITGGASFITDNGTNLGNVTNWTINAGASGDFYWVGGAGNWSDPDHWSATSGGAYPSGGACIPSDVDNVFFDANSFSSLGEILYVDVNATCNNMNWTGVTNNPQVQNAGGGSLHVFGSLTFATGITYNGPSITFRSDNPGNTITSAGLTLTTDFTFEGNGEWQLADNLFITGSITFNKGFFSTGNKAVTANYISSYSFSNRTIDLGTSTVTCSSWNIYEGTNLTVNAGTSEIILSGGYFYGGGKIYNNLTLQNTNSSYIDGANSFNIINDSGNGDLVFGAGKINSFTNLIATGNCSNPLYITSTVAGQQATLSSTGIINVDFANIKDIDAIGGGTFNANNSVDAGNNSGWNFILLAGTDYYWIGGAGNWNDPAHWSLTSGGVANPGGCIPSQVDNVFFNANSGLNLQSVTINQNASCNNMDWTGSVNARLSGTSSYSLNIYGSFVFNASALYLFNGNINFKSNNAGNIIDTKGKTIIGTPYFDGSGEWTLQSSFSTQTTVNKYIYFNKGTLNTNNNSITTTNFYSNTQNTRVLNLGSSVINVSNWSIYDGLNMTINPGTSVINYSGSSFNGGNLDYNNVTTSSTGYNYIYDSNTYNILNLSTVSSALFEGGTTQTFTTLLIPNGISCTNYFNLSSATQGTAVNFNMAAGSFTGDWLQITDITAGGGGTFTANNSLGIGDVTGWVINGVAGVNLYWVGGAGSWNDPIHWSLSSGGPSYGCIPTTEDNVFFDSNSFMLPGQTLDINVNAYCKNMDWTGVTNTPSVTGWSSLSVNGSLTLVVDINFMYNGVIKFISSSAGNLIKSAGKTITGIELNGTGEYSLSGNLNIGWSSISFNNGTFNTNGFDINMTSDFNSNSSNIRTLNLSTSNITLSNWSITNSTNMTLNAGTSVISLESNSFNFNGGGFTYNDVNLSSPSFGFLMLSGSNTFNNLFINPATEIHFQDGSTQSISNLDAFGNAGFEIILKSNIDGSVANINQTSHEFCGNYLKIQDIVASGTTFYAGDNSTDMGNNSGWTWSGVTAINQYPAGMCEDVFGGGTVAGVNLTLLESTIDGGNGYTHSWFRDYDLTIPVLFPANVTVSNGQAFYDAVNNGTCTNIAEVIYTVYSRPTLSTIVTNVTCNGLSDGAIGLTVTSDNSPYTYLWDNAAVTEDISGIVAGNYIVTVTDSYGCTNITSATVTEPSTLTASAISTNISCNGSSDGTIDLTVAGGTTAYSYLWDDTGNSTTEDLAGLLAGTYNVTVTDANNCTATASATVNEPALLTASATDVDIDCFGNANGSINLTVSGGTPVYSFLWDNAATTEDLSGLSAGTYNVTITDANGCTANSSSVITEPMSLGASVARTDVDCNGNSTGAIDLTVIGGVTPYSFLWSNSATTEDISGLVAGTYFVTITDFNNCTFVNNYSIMQPSALSANIVNTDIDCNGNTNGTINNTPSGGTTPYTFLWSNTATTEDLSGLSAGTYIITVTDANNCTATASATVNEPALLTASATDVDIDCFGNANGSINLTVSGGTPVYSFLWDNAATTEDLSGLSTGTYNVTITDANGCTTNSSSVIAEPMSLGASVARTDVDCNGNSTGAIDLTVIGGVTPYSFLWSNSATTEDISGLVAGTYFVTITDFNNCTFVNNYSIMQPSALSANIVKTDIDCNGNTNGSINNTPSGGTTPYTFLWSNTATTEDLSGLSAGTYIITVTDANNCTATASATVSEPLALEASSTGSDVLCNGGTTTVTVSAVGGVVPYINTGNYTEIAGTYNYLVTDANGCTSNTSITINEPSALAVSSILTNVTCNGGNDGAIDITVSGGTTPYSLNWDNGSTTEDISGLTAGMYNGTITDANGCTLSGGDVITEPLAIDITASITDVLCYTGNNGAINVTVSGGTSPYTFLWSGNETTEDLSGLVAGTYDVTVTDNAFCTATASFTVTEPAAWIITSALTHVSCNGLSDGAIDVTVSGGTSPFTYSWTGGLTTEDISGLSAGVYQLLITDNNGCTNGHDVTINEPSIIAISIFEQDNVSCNAGSDGFININVTGGVTPYTYLWTGGLTTEDISGLFAGTYDITVTDNNGCNSSSTFTVTEPLQFNSSVTWSDVTCNGGNDGSIDLTLVNGISPFTVLWSNGATTEDVSGLTAGHYTVSITDANGCYTDIYADIAEPTAITVTTTTITHENAGSDGAIDIAVLGGTTPYTFLWSGGETTEDITGLVAGIYSVTVTDANGCQKVKPNIVVNNIACTLTASLSGTNLLCNGDNTGAALATANGGTSPFTYLWSNNETTDAISGLSAGTYSVTVTDNTNCIVVETIDVNEPNALSASSVNINVSCFGESNGAIDITVSGGTTPYTFAWDNSSTTEDLTGLLAGTYLATITDANSCTYMFGEIISEPLQFNSSATWTDVTCNGGNDGSVDLTLVNGISPFTVLWSNGETTEDVSGLTAGHYTVSITDANGCYTDIYADIAEPLAITASIAESNIDCNGNVNGGADLTVTNGVAPYTFLWDDASNNTTEDLTDVVAGTYNVTVTDNNGCTATASTTITEPSAILVSSIVTNVSCYGENSGSIDVTVSGGTTPYTFAWDNSSTTEDLTGLLAGTYLATITDANSCTYMFGEIISEPLQFNSSVAWSDVTCNGGNDGSVDLTLVNGISPFSVIWSTGATTEDVSGLTVGNYTVSITDANGCYTDIYADIAEPSAISISVSVTDENTGNDGGVDITVSGGTTPYTFQWNDTGNTTTEDLTNISAGIYSVTVTDANGCSMIESNIVVNNVSCTLSAVAIGTDLSCNGDNSGTASVIASGGTTPFTYNWTNAETTDAISGLAAGTYSVTVTDSNACVAIETVLVSEPVALSSFISSTDVACYGMNNGAADLTVTGGTSPYTFVWDNSQTTEDISGLSGGTYNVTITDFNNCQDFASVTISEPVSPIDTNSVVTDVTCFGASDGAIDFIVSGGTTPYTYLWSNGETTEDLSGLSSGAYLVTITDANNCSAQLYSYVDEPAQIINSVTAEICDGDSIMLEGAYQYTAGTYTDILVALNGCDSTVITELIVHPVYNITETVQICSGSDYVLPNGTTVNTDGTYTSNLNTVFGCDSIIVTNLVTTAQIVNNIALTICEGDSIFAEGSWQYATGIFHDTTTAVAGCDSIIITDLTVNPLIMVDLGADDTLCFETADVLTLDAGNAGMSYLWSDGSTAQTFVADAIALGMGTHTIGVTVTDGVCTSTDEIVLLVDICSGIVAVNEQLNVSMYPNPTKGKLNIAIEGLNSEATLSIMDVSGRTIMNEILSSETTMKQVDFSNLPKGIYAVKVTSGDVVKVNRIVVQ